MRSLRAGRVLPFLIVTLPLLAKRRKAQKKNLRDVYRNLRNRLRTGGTEAMWRYSLILLSGTATAALLFLSAPSSSAQKKPNYWTIGGFAKYVTIPGATRVGSEACAACHAALNNNFRHAFHAQQGIECEDCHGAGGSHVEGRGDVTKIVSYGRRSVREANGACLSCHAQDERIRNWSAGAHSSNHVRCTDCHQIHDGALKSANEGRFSFDLASRRELVAESVSPETNVILRSKSEGNDACLKCHQTQGAQLSMPYHHPLREGKMSCGDCHDPHGGPGGNNLRTANANQLCLTCHAHYRGPFAYQHPPVTENCMLCHTAHGSPNTNLLTVSEPALCLQCHAGHHNGAGLPLPDRCTNCHASIHGTDVPTPSGGSRFFDKGPSDPSLFSTPAPDPPALAASRSKMTASSRLRPVPSRLPPYAVGAAGGVLGMLSSGFLSPLSGENMSGGSGGPAGTETGAAYGAYSITPGAYRFVDRSGFSGRVGEYDSLQQSAGAEAVTSFVLPGSHLTVVSRASVLTGDDYSFVSQVTAGDWLQFGFDTRSFVQQQDHYTFYAFPRLDVIQGPPCNGVPCDTTTDSISAQNVFGLKRRLGNASARVKVPKLPVHLFVNGSWVARVGTKQLTYMDENTLLLANFPCGTQCHFASQFQPVNYTTRSVGGGVDVKLGQVLLTWKHYFSSFNDRLVFPMGTFTGEFDPAADPFGVRPGFPPPSGPTPRFVNVGNYPVQIPAPNQSSTDSLSLNWTASPKLTFNGNLSYTRLRNMFTRNPQNSLNTDQTLNLRPIDHLRIIADYHQQNLINNFTPFYSLYGNVSYHDHSEGVRLDYELPKGFDAELRYKRSGITRSNAFLWPQIYSVDNTDLLGVVNSSTSNTTGLTLRYHHGGWSARAGYEWTGTHSPGYLIVPRSNNRAFADVWLTPAKWLVFSNYVSVIAQNDFPAIPLPNTPNGTARPLASPGFNVNITGLPPAFQRRNRFYTETASATLRFVPGWNLGLGYSYQQNNMNSYMSFQNDSLAGYILDEPLVPYKQISQVYWGESTYTFKERLGLNLRLTYNSSRSGYRPNLNTNDAAALGNAFLMTIPGAFNPDALAQALGTGLNGDPNQGVLKFSSTQISQVIVPQYIGQAKIFYVFQRRFDGGVIFYYGSYRDQLNPNLNGVLRTFTVYVGRSW